MAFFIYIVMLSAPDSSVRLAISPRIYSGTLLYMVAINLVIVALCYHTDLNASLYLSERLAWFIIGISTFFVCIGGAITVAFVPQTHKHTLYEPMTGSKYNATILWNEKTCILDHKRRPMEGQEAVRALIAVRNSIHYLPQEKLRAYFKERWGEWVANPPLWFDAEYRALVPRELLVDVDPALWEEVEDNNNNNDDV